MANHKIRKLPLRTQNRYKELHRKKRNKIPIVQLSITIITRQEQLDELYSMKR